MSRDIVIQIVLLIFLLLRLLLFRLDLHLQPSKFLFDVQNQALEILLAGNVARLLHILHFLQLFQSALKLLQLFVKTLLLRLVLDCITRQATVAIATELGFQRVEGQFDRRRRGEYVRLNQKVQLPSLILPREVLEYRDL